MLNTVPHLTSHLVQTQWHGKRYEGTCNMQGGLLTVHYGSQSKMAFGYEQPVRNQMLAKEMLHELIAQRPH
ncbi:hypothetical protein [Magnetococcus sp. PR-3]|uniref:hypothetical protein n=1 Tax=Magnetococcus sp. PR-3 TaxID=3120355 RepID=UPI002FCE607F